MPRQQQRDRFDALGYDFAIRTTHPELFEHFATVFRHLRRNGEPSHLYEVHVGDGEADLHAVTLDGETLVETRWPVVAFRRVVWHVNQQVIATTPHLLLHAGAVSIPDGRVIGLPAAMGSGKSTLVAGLVEAGASYLSDEFLALDQSTGDALPYPRAISLDPGSWEVLAHLRPAVPDNVEPFVEDQWQVDPDSIRSGAVGSGGRLGLVVFPRYSSDGETMLEPLTRAEALIEMTQNTFHFSERGQAALGLLAEVVGGCDCYRLTFSDLKTAASLVLEAAQT